MPDDMLTTQEVADAIGVTADSLRSYVSRGKFPRPDGYLAATPWWSPETVAEWIRNRPPMGRPKKDA